MSLSPSRFIAALGLSVTLASPVLAQTPPAPAAPTPAAPAPAAPGTAAQPQMPLSQIIAGLEAQGYVVHEVDVGRRHIEVEAVGADGKKVDLEVSPADGTVLHIEEDR